MGTNYHNQRIAEYREDLEDDKKSLAEAESQLKEAIKWKYKMLRNVVDSYERLAKLEKEVEHEP